jgi:hypothetical protein
VNVIGSENEFETRNNTLPHRAFSVVAKGHLALTKVLDGDVVRMVPNAAEMAVIKQMQDMRAAGASLREIGAATGQGFRNVKRILERMAKG